MSDLLFWATLALLATHELDAVYRREWRMLPGFRHLPEHFAAELFIGLHAPLFLAIFLAAQAGANSQFALCLSAFAVIHLGLHRLFRTHPAYRFHGIWSRAFIGSAGMCGAAHLVFAIAG